MKNKFFTHVFEPLLCKGIIFRMEEFIMIMLTIDTVPGKEIEALGVVKGSTVQSKNMFKDMGQGFKSMVGGELKSYTKMMDEARDIATQRMLQEAQSVGADAVIGVRYATSAVMQGAAEIMAFGTAVKFKG